MKIDFNKPISVPVLFMVFNRPEKTQKVFDVIKAAKPKKLYVAADAPRDNNTEDIMKCKNVRDIVSKIDWECKTEFLFQKKNLGCTTAGITAWNWIFSKEEEMIFIEDDGLISKSFFWFCQSMLKKYKYDERIAYIGGTNFGDHSGDYSYFFTRYGAPTMAMATWKRVHDKYDYNLDTYNDTKNLKSYRDNFLFHFEYLYYKRRMDRYLKKGGNSYDIQIVYLRYKYNMYNIVPNINFVTNIGLDWGGANNSIDPTSNFAKKYGNRERFEISEIIHPPMFSIDTSFEKKNLLNRVFLEKSLLHVFIMIYLSYPYRILRRVFRILFLRK